MTDYEYQITKSSVMDDVNKLTSYAGAKTTQADGSNAYDRVFATNDDYTMLEKFWVEGISFVTGNLRRHISAITQTNEGTNSEVLSIILMLSDRFDANQNPTIVKSIKHYFINSIASKWLLLTKPEDAPQYEELAKQCIIDILSKVNYKKPATRT